MSVRKFANPKRMRPSDDLHSVKDRVRKDVKVCCENIHNTEEMREFARNRISQRSCKVPSQEEIRPLRECSELSVS